MGPLTLPRITPREFFEANLKQDIAKYNEAVDRNEANHKNLKRMRDEVNSQDVAAVDFGNLIEIPTVKSAHLLTLQSEICLRRELDILYNRVSEALLAFAEVSFQKLDLLKADVRKKLLAIGYTDDSIKPGYILTHPAVRRLAGDIDAYRNQASDTSGKRLNLEALQYAELQLNATRREALRA